MSKNLLQAMFMGLAASALLACAPQKGPEKDTLKDEAWTDLSKRDKPSAIVDMPWQSVIIGVPDLLDAPRLFQDIGGFTVRAESEDGLTLGAPGVGGGLLHFQKTAENAVQTRPFGSRSWDTGCYFSVMMRAKDMPSIIADAKGLGWEPLTDMTYLEFGPSKLNIVVLGHKKTGLQVQLYERLTTPLPEGFPEFKRISRPFNMMQMVRDRDAAYTFYQQGLGLETFYFGKPYLSKTEKVMPLGIPPELTTTTPYQAGIVTPKQGLEWGRMEMIEVMMDGGKDLAGGCEPGNIGIHTVRFKVDDIAGIRKDLRARNVKIVQSSNDSLRVKTPDGANIEFVQK